MSSKRAQRALPRSLARYIAASASRSSSSGLASRVPVTVTPTLAVRKRCSPSSTTGGRSESARRSQIRSACASSTTSRQQDRELVAAEAGHQVALAQNARQPLRDLGEQPVAGRVPERVVDDLEVVEVDERDRNLTALSAAPLDRLAEPVHEDRAVRQVGEEVVLGAVFELGLGQLALRDVDALRHEVRVPLGILGHRRVTPERPADAAVGALEAGLVLLARSGRTSRRGRRPHRRGRGPGCASRADPARSSRSSRRATGSRARSRRRARSARSRSGRPRTRCGSAPRSRACARGPGPSRPERPRSAAT